MFILAFAGETRWSCKGLLCYRSFIHYRYITASYTALFLGMVFIQGDDGHGYRNQLYIG